MTAELRRTPHPFVPAIDDGLLPEARDVGACCGLVRAAWVHDPASAQAARDRIEQPR